MNGQLVSEGGRYAGTGSIGTARTPGGGLSIRDGRRPGHWARLTDSDGDRYAHVAVVPNDDGTLTDLPAEPPYPHGTTERWPAVEVNGRTDVPVRTGSQDGAVVWLEFEAVTPGYRFTFGGGGGLRWFRVTAMPAEDPGPYTGVAGSAAADGSWADLVPTVFSEHLYRAPSNQDVPLIPVGQVVLGQLETETADDPPDSPPRYRITPWGGFFRYKEKVLIRVECDGGNLVNIYKWEYRAAREFCISPAPPD